MMITILPDVKRLPFPAILDISSVLILVSGFFPVISDFMLSVTDGVLSLLSIISVGRKPHRAAAELIRLQYEIAVFTSVYVDTADGVILSDEVYRFSSVYRHTVRLKFGLYHGGRCAVFRRCFS